MARLPPGTGWEWSPRASESEEGSRGLTGWVVPPSRMFLPAYALPAGRTCPAVSKNPTERSKGCFSWKSEHASAPESGTTTGSANLFAGSACGADQPGVRAGTRWHQHPLDPFRTTVPISREPERTPPIHQIHGLPYIPIAGAEARKSA